MSTSSVRPRPRSSGSIKAPNRPPPPPPRSASIQKQAMQSSAILPQRPALPPNTSPTRSPEKQHSQSNSSVQMEQNASMSPSASISKMPNDQIMEKYVLEEEKKARLETEEQLRSVRDELDKLKDTSAMAFDQYGKLTEELEQETEMREKAETLAMEISELEQELCQRPSVTLLEEFNQLERSTIIKTAFILFFIFIILIVSEITVEELKSVRRELEQEREAREIAEKKAQELKADLRALQRQSAILMTSAAEDEKLSDALMQIQQLQSELSEAKVSSEAKNLKKDCQCLPIKLKVMNNEQNLLSLKVLESSSSTTSSPGGIPGAADPMMSMIASIKSGNIALKRVQKGHKKSESGPADNDGQSDTNSAGNSPVTPRRIQPPLSPVSPFLRPSPVSPGPTITETPPSSPTPPVPPRSKKGLLAPHFTSVHYSDNKKIIE
ncbi:calponin homology domain-containing protein DDB_G0272472-like, partial [Gigantopelta aegis]|uniref:calponin homology domain-containing protein DDB_G0272472-like n=1 Tax=Gigantopelta aegis TaxID=1735272 RepID=UPI001B88C952